MQVCIVLTWEQIGQQGDRETEDADEDVGDSEINDKVICHVAHARIAQNHPHDQGVTHHSWTTHTHPAVLFL